MPSPKSEPKEPKGTERRPGTQDPGSKASQPYDAFAPRRKTQPRKPRTTKKSIMKTEAKKTEPRKKKLSRAERNIQWIEENCRIPEGKFVGQPVKLRDWQKRIIRKIYDNPHGTRRAIISFGRKNAKTTLCGFLLLLHLVGPEAQPNSQLLSAAQSRDQAALLFNLAAKMVRFSPRLNTP